jgi:hypothetical protein
VRWPPDATEYIVCLEKRRSVALRNRSDELVLNRCNTFRISFAGIVDRKIMTLPVPAIIECRHRESGRLKSWRPVLVIQGRNQQ